MLAAELEGVARGFLDERERSACCACTRSRAEASSWPRTRGAATRSGRNARPDRLDARRRRSRSGSRRPCDSLGPVSDGVEVRTRNGDVLRARTCVLTVPLNVLPQCASIGLSAAKRDAIALGQASRGIKSG